ncbi:MAG: UDP-N-acetylglucosamine 2-epimerase [Candidatus Thermoplasmatota archaeon]|nr:UDP-N-acetyl glucosamine 2-epimerase [Euryarchaeota archaeon]MBU4031470.1 UDP-N-acetylglucosamine 2-epimerase [Candidatus Thermoplasmatota archaeon]MBU4072210.1 UDP-N-acetylglucosamine 2-epimerase [Candidatus Thermoplasmatota archaeon]MBU4143977.1 UDP-N-acetylglucosamine 2-epimerase [Candidatus Thermoplasmatota archaeon]MBU4591909.1 UDP-N-acetylglucosamine 2-epimerase [Candidatus Thermoplasmatota archaeon]
MPIHINPSLFEKSTSLAISQGHNRVLLIVTATKPCFYKLWGVMNECIKQELPFIILHSGQHYDEIVGHGLKEFSFDEFLGIDYNLRGDLVDKSAELFVKTKVFANYCKTEYPDILFVPYVNGDTMTAGIFPAAWLFSTNHMCIHGEAGLRSMAPKQFNKLTGFESPSDLIEWQWNPNWEVIRNEPFPEQYDTFIAGAGCACHFPPVNLNADHLIREGYDPSTVHVVGNTVVDVISAKESKNVGISVFDEYPKLKNGNWLRMDIHRRENLNPKRFETIVSFVEQLVEQGHYIAFIELTGTKLAINKYGLRERFDSLNEKDNFILTPIWKEYCHVIEFLRSENCKAILTDSGSMQEEMNQLQKPCFTIRFSTDRPETVMAKGNLLVPPLRTEQMVGIVEHVLNNEDIFSNMKTAPRLYGSNVSNSIVKIIKTLFKNKDQFFYWATERLGIYKDDDFPEYL